MYWYAGLSSYTKSYLFALHLFITKSDALSLTFSTQTLRSST